MGDKLHFAAHSHHLWPDCVADAHQQYVLDGFAEADEKWGKSIIAIETQLKSHLQELMHLDDPNRLCFSPTIHTLLYRLISCFDLTQPLNILSSDSEFYSFTRQVNRLAEYDHIQSKEVAVLPFQDFKERFLLAIKEGQQDIIYISQVFFNSGLTVDFLEEIVETAHPDTMIIIDGYHACGAIPVDLTTIQSKVFYLGGGYKYMQAGEGICFMSVPDHLEKYRPLYTGWFAEFDSLEDNQNTVPYAPDARRFLGATSESAGMYRMCSVFNMWKANNMTIEKIHDYVLQLQLHFLAKLAKHGMMGLTTEDLIITQQKASQFGHFLTFNTDQALAMKQVLQGKNITVDSRADRLRFGFGTYQTTSDIDALFERLG